MNVFVYDPFVDKDKIEKLGGKKVDNLEEITKLTSLCSKADIQSKTINKEESWLIIEIILVYLSQKKMSLDVHLENKLNF
jgi:hypothetical protein